MRREFSKRVKRDALKRAAGCCEGIVTTMADGSAPGMRIGADFIAFNGIRCGARFGVKFHFDHDIADGLGGEPTLENCKVLCYPCHDEKTRKHDVPLIAKTKRISDKFNGIRTTRQKIQSAGFRKPEPQRTASRPIERHNDR